MLIAHVKFEKYISHSQVTGTEQVYITNGQVDGEKRGVSDFVSVGHTIYVHMSFGYPQNFTPLKLNTFTVFFV